jgi:hypothetical protein
MHLWFRKGRLKSGWERPGVRQEPRRIHEREMIGRNALGGR